MLRTRWIQIGLLIAVMASAGAPCVWARFQVPPPCNNAFTEAQEIAEGRQIAAQVFQQMPVLPDGSPVSQYVRRLGARLVTFAPGYRWPYAFHVVASEDSRDGGAAGRRDSARDLARGDAPLDLQSHQVTGSEGRLRDRERTVVRAAGKFNLGIDCTGGDWNRCDRCLHKDVARIRKAGGPPRGGHSARRRLRCAGHGAVL